MSFFMISSYLLLSKSVQLICLVIIPKFAKLNMPFLFNISSLIIAFLAKGFQRSYLFRMMIGFERAPKCNLPFDFDYFYDIFLIT